MDFIYIQKNFYPPEPEFCPVGEILKPMKSKEALPLILLRIYFDLGCLVSLFIKMLQYLLLSVE